MTVMMTSKMKTKTFLMKTSTAKSKSTHVSMKKSAKGIVYIALYIDNNLMICKMTSLVAIAVLKSKGPGLKIAVGLQDYFSCEITFSDD